jgi:CheY-like chemotaxis protein
MKTILIIVDKTDIRENICEILVAGGRKVISAAEGITGLALAKENKPDIILCDIIMPGFDGYKVFHGLKDDFETSDIPFVFLIPNLGKKEDEAGLDIGDSEFIRKPFVTQELLDTIARCLNEN